MAVTLPPVPSRPRVPPLAAFLEGWRRVVQAPALLAGTWIAWWSSWQLVRSALEEPGPRLQAHVLSGPAWAASLYFQMDQLAHALAPEIAPFFSTDDMPSAFLAALAVQATLWTFLSGGILDRYARGRPIRTAAFFAACGVYFLRFLRLAAIVVVAGYGLWRIGHAFAGDLLVAGVVLLVVGGMGLVVGFAKVRAVVEDRHSMIGALAASWRFIRRRPWRVLALAALNVIAVLIVVRLQLQVLGTAGPWWLSGVLSAILLLFGIAVRLAFLASEAVFFQGELAHAGYTATPPYEWPDSAAIEAMENLVRRSDRTLGGPAGPESRSPRPTPD